MNLPSSLISPLWRTQRTSWSPYSGERKMPSKRREGDLVAIGRRSVAERLVRALLVVETLKVAQTFELFAHALCRRGSDLLQEGQVHALVATVLLRLAGGDAFRRNTGLDQRHRQF